MRQAYCLQKRKQKENSNPLKVQDPKLRKNYDREESSQLIQNSRRIAKLGKKGGT